jgi:hypothetical protein
MALKKYKPKLHFPDASEDADRDAHGAVVNHLVVRDIKQTYSRFGDSGLSFKEKDHEQIYG